MKVLPIRLGIIALLVFQCLLIASAQKPEISYPNEITFDDFFSRTRSLSTDLTKGSEAFKFKKPTYRLKRITKAVKPIAAKRVRPPSSPKKSYSLPVDTKSEEVWKRLGVTIWRIAAESKDGDSTPKRVSSETEFKKGDQIRLSLESPAAGYLYVIDREIYSDGKVGIPRLVFPTMMSRGGNNRVEAGQMIDVPGQADRVAFFKLDSKNDKWRGEWLTVIVSPEPLKDIDIPEEISPLPVALVDAVESKYLKAVGEYELPGTAGMAYTQAEKEAGGSLTRELTQKDPFPQTMFRVKMRQREPMLVSFGLKVK